MARHFLQAACNARDHAGEWNTVAPGRSAEAAAVAGSLRGSIERIRRAADTDAAAFT